MALALLLVMGVSAAQAAEDPARSTPATAGTNPAISLSISAPAVSAPSLTADPVPAPSPTLGVDPAPSPADPVGITSTAPALDDPATEIVTEGLIASAITLGSPTVSRAESDAEVQRRLEAPSPEVLIERHGSIGFLLKNPEPRKFLDLINPFAPDDYGPREREIYNRDPNLKPGATLPRTFVNDMTHEPSMGLFDWIW